MILSAILGAISAGNFLKISDYVWIDNVYEGATFVTFTGSDTPAVFAYDKLLVHNVEGDIIKSIKIDSDKQPLNLSKKYDVYSIPRQFSEITNQDVEFPLIDYSQPALDIYQYGKALFVPRYSSISIFGSSFDVTHQCDSWHTTAAVNKDNSMAVFISYVNGTAQLTRYTLLENDDILDNIHKVSYPLLLHGSTPLAILRTINSSSFITNTKVVFFAYPRVNINSSISGNIKRPSIVDLVVADVISGKAISIASFRLSVHAEAVGHHSGKLMTVKNNLFLIYDSRAFMIPVKKIVELWDGSDYVGEWKDN